MQSNIRMILLTVIALVVGLGLGYLLFGKNKTVAPATGHDHGLEAQLTANEEGTIWTCSMHPQIRQNEPGLCPICGMELIPLDETASGAAGDPLVLQMTSEAVKLANIQTTIVGATGKPEKTIALTGKVQEDERLAASQVAHIPGRIEQLFISFTGERVRKGQKLAVIYSPELVTAQRELLEAIRFRDINPTLVTAARQKLKYWKIDDEAIKEIEQRGEVQETFTIYADAEGYVTSRRIAVGDYVRQGQVLFDIVNLNQVWVLFDAYEEDLANIRLGDRVEFTTPALPNRTFTTRITYIDPVIDPKMRTAALRAEVSNGSGLLKPEMLVRGVIQSRLSAQEKLMVPKSAVMWTGPRSVVYIKVPNASVPSFRYREVSLGDALGNSYLIEEGLEPGEEVVTYGNFAIDAAAQLNNQQSMMNKVVQMKGMQTPGIPDYMHTTADEFKQQIYALTGQYLGLKDALVASDPETAQEAAASFSNQLQKTDMSLLKGDAHMYWMDQLKGMEGHIRSIQTGADIEEQRRQFSFLSSLMIKTIQAFGMEGREVYVQHCPMAMDNEGADWLSLRKDIRNPYFGDKMLTCGENKGTLPLKMEMPASDTKVNPNQFHNH